MQEGSTCQVLWLSLGRRILGRGGGVLTVSTREKKSHDDKPYFSKNGLIYYCLSDFYNNKNVIYRIISCQDGIYYLSVSY